MDYGMCIVIGTEEALFVPFKYNIDDNIVSIISSRIMTTVDLFQKEYSEGESIVAFPEINTLTFFHYFEIKPKDKDSVSSPAVVIFTTNIENRLQTHQNIGKLSNIAKAIIKNIWGVIERQKVSKEKSVRDFFNKAFSSEVLNALFSQEIQLLTELTTIATRVPPNLDLWVNFANRGIDRIIFALLLNKPIAFLVENREQAERHLANVNLFRSTNKPLISEWTSLYDNQVEIQFGPIELKESLPPSIIIFNDLTKKIEGGKPSKFCLELFQDLIDQELEEVLKVLQKVHIGLSSASETLLSQITALLDQQQDDSAQLNSLKLIIEEFKQKISEKELQMIDAFMHKINPGIMEEVKQRYFLEYTYAQTIQEAVINEVGPVGSVIINRALKEMNPKYRELNSENVSRFVDHVMGIIEPKQIMTPEEFQRLRGHLLQKIEEYQLLLKNSSIFTRK
ncbi:MAG: hypothetical protein ACFFBD_21480 [Candidatus Hodarchaeota archaeon]